MKNALRVVGSLLLVALVTTGAALAAPSHPISPQDTTTDQHEPDPLRHPIRVDRAARIVVSAPDHARTGDRIRISGAVLVHTRVALRRPRPVVLQERRHHRWRTLARKHSTRAGKYGFGRAAGRRAGVRRFRVVAPRHRGLARGVQRFHVTVVDREVASTPDASGVGYTPLGDARDWRYLYRYDGGAARWPSCRRITWSYDPEGQYPGAGRHLAVAFRRIAANTGLAFRRTATGGDITVAWESAETEPDLAGGVVGIGGGRYGWDGVVRSGALALDKGDAGLLRRGYDVAGSPTWGQVMQHELLHVLGLDHATGREQLMYGAVSSLNHRFGAGDLTGMDRIGKGSC